MVTLTPQMSNVYKEITPSKRTDQK